MAEDARQRIKTFIDTHTVDANLTKDDDVTEVTWISAFSDPPYPLKMVFHSVKNVDLIYSIETPVTEAKVASDGSIYKYCEHVPVVIQCIRKRDIDGNKLRWKAEAELRRILEENPISSYHSMDRSEPFDKDMGGWMLFGIRTVVTYERDTT